MSRNLKPGAADVDVTRLDSDLVARVQGVRVCIHVELFSRCCCV